MILAINKKTVSFYTAKSPGHPGLSHTKTNLYHALLPAIGCGQTKHLYDRRRNIGQAVIALLDGVLYVLVVDDKGNGIEGVRGSYLHIALLVLLQHFVRVAVVGC